MKRLSKVDSLIHSEFMRYQDNYYRSNYYRWSGVMKEKEWRAKEGYPVKGD